MKTKVLSINTVCGYVATGRITACLSKTEEFKTLVCYGRKKDYAKVKSYKFANFFDNAFGAIRTILFDNNLNICSLATKRLIRKIKKFNPDIIHLHNLHGYYVNVEMLFKFLKEYNKPIIWTLHDCWPATGYCPAADYVECKNYEKGCVDCKFGFNYPFSIFKQNIRKDFNKKKLLFNSINNLTIVTPSRWMADIISTSHLKNNDITVINNGINLNAFYQSKPKNQKFTVLTVANVWTYDKGKEDIQKIIDLLDKDVEVVIVGTFSNKFERCTSIKHTDSIKELIDLYSSSHVLINPTLDDNFPAVNIESLACGTPVITYKTGGSPEIIDDKTGIIIRKGDYVAMANVINSLKDNYYFKSEDCINRSRLFSEEKMKNNYYNLYRRVLEK